MTRSLKFFAILALFAVVLGGLSRHAVAQGSSLLIVPKKADPNQLISFTFNDANIDDVLRFLADATGKLIFKDPGVVGTVTIRAQSRIPVAQAVRLIQTILELKGYTLIDYPEADAYLVTTAAAGRAKGPISIGKDPKDIPAGEGVITHIFPLANVDAARLQQEITALFPSSSIIANAETNTLIVTDAASVVRRVGTLVNLLDKPTLQDEITLEVFHLMYADATEMARYLTDLFRPDDNAQQGGQGNNQQGRFGGFGGFQPGGAAPGAPGAGNRGGATGGLAALRGRMRFAADTHSNSLLVYGSPANIAKVRDLINRIDVSTAPRADYRIVPLKFADASGLADQINQLINPNGNQNRGGFGGFFGGFGGGGQTASTTTGLQDYRVVADVRTNSVIITAPKDTIDKIEALVHELDKPSQVSDVVRVFQLQNAIASEVATTLRNLFLGNQQTGGVGVGLFGAGGRTQIPPNSPLDLLRQVTIVPNDQTNQILISGPAQTFPVIEQLLSETQGLDRRLPQVFIEVVIADVTLDNLTKYGIEFNAISGQNAFGTNFGLTSPTADPTGFSYSIVSKNFQATLRALQTTSKINIVSTPHVMVTDNSPALITIGESIPYAGQTTITSGLAQTSVAFQDVAITLNVTPHISPGNHILMDIDQVVNSLIEFITVSPGQQAPRTTNRRAGTTVIVQDDQTVCLGGIISNQKNKTVNKFPILGDLPLIGNLFRNTTKEKERTELVVFITPHIVREAGAADDIRGYERSRLQVDPLKILDAPFHKPLDLKPADILPKGGLPQGVPPAPVLPNTSTPDPNAPRYNVEISPGVRRNGRKPLGSPTPLAPVTPGGPTVAPQSAPQKKDRGKPQKDPVAEVPAKDKG